MNNQKSLSEVIRSVIQNIFIYFKTKGKTFLVGWGILALGLGFLEVNYWVWIALLIMFFDLIPMVGSGLIMIPWSIIVMIDGNVTRGFLLLGLYILRQIVENVLENVWVGKAMQMPIWIPFVVTIGCSIAFGPLGILVAAIAIPVLGTLINFNRRV